MTIPPTIRLSDSKPTCDVYRPERFHRHFHVTPASRTRILRLQRTPRGGSSCTLGHYSCYRTPKPAGPFLSAEDLGATFDPDDLS